MTRPVTATVLVLGLAMAAGAQEPELGRRYRVDLDGLAPLYVDDLRRDLGLTESGPGLADPPAALPVGPPPAGPAAPPGAPRVEVEAGKAVPDTAGAGPLPVPEELPEALAAVPSPGAGPGPGPGPGPAAPGEPAPDWFKDRLASIYMVTDPEVVDAVWILYQAEPDGLEQAPRVGNAVIKNAYATGRIPPPGRVVQPSPTGTRGTVIDPQGVQVRTAPWEAGTTVLPQGASFEVVPPPEGIWYRLAGGGYVPALWVDVQD